MSNSSLLKASGMESLTETRLDPLYVQIWLTKGKQNEATDRNQIGATLCKIWFTKEKQRLEPLTETRWEPFYVKSGLLNVNKTLIINFIKQIFLICKLLIDQSESEW